MYLLCNTIMHNLKIKINYRVTVHIILIFKTYNDYYLLFISLDRCINSRGLLTIGIYYILCILYNYLNIF